MKHRFERRRARHQPGTEIRDLTPDLLELVRSSGIENGVAIAFVPGSTAAITTIEHEPGALEDLKEALERIAPEHGRYHHNETAGDTNGHSHLRAALLGPSVSVPIIEGRLCLGTWQQIVLLDFDDKPRTREVILQVMGE